MATDDSVLASSLLVDLPAISSSAAVQELLAKPVLRALMVEYCCWDREWLIGMRGSQCGVTAISQAGSLRDGRYSTGSTSSNSPPVGLTPSGGYLIGRAFRRGDSSVVHEAVDHRGVANTEKRRLTTAKDAPAKKAAAKKTATRGDPPAAPGADRVSGPARRPADARSRPNRLSTTTTAPSRSSVVST
jgi:hypothetical protein